MIDMTGNRPLKTSKTVVHWLLAIVIFLLIVTGFGITEFHIIEFLTFGLLTKNLAHQIHTSLALWLSFLVFLGLHVGIARLLRQKRGRVSL